MILARRVGVFIGLVMFSAQLTADDRALLFGGGPNPVRTQFSIESNVLWFDTLLRSGSFSHVTTQFGSGGAHPNEISRLSVDPGATGTAPFSIVFGAEELNRLRFEPSTVISSTASPLTKEQLVRIMGNELDSLAESDSLFITYSGHGGGNDDSAENYLYLWDNTELSVREMDTVLRRAKIGTTARFVLPQCFSGGFSRLAFQNLNPEEGIKQGARVCGFTAVPDDRIAEGCTSSINTAEYRDYASMLFSALSGRTREGSVTSRSADADGNGHISLREAHLFALAYGESTDIPRSTSEDYLLSTESWSQRWASYDSANTKNEYMSAAHALSADFQQAFGSVAYLQESRERLAAARILAEGIEGQLVEMRHVVSGLREDIQAELKLRWPTLTNPYTEQYLSTMASEGEAINAWIVEQPSYAQLLVKGHDLASTEDRLLRARREEAKLERIHRLLKLSRLHEHLIKQTHSRELEEYMALRDCESWVPPLQALRVNQP